MCIVAQLFGCFYIILCLENITVNFYMIFTNNFENNFEFNLLIFINPIHVHDLDNYDKCGEEIHIKAHMNVHLLNIINGLQLMELIKVHFILFNICKIIAIIAVSI